MPPLRLVVFLAVFLTARSQKQLCLHSFALRRLRCTACHPEINIACSNGEFLRLASVQEIEKKYTFKYLVLDSDFRTAPLFCEVSDSPAVVGNFSVKRTDFKDKTLLGHLALGYTLQLKLCDKSEAPPPLSRRTTETHMADRFKGIPKDLMMKSSDLKVEKMQPMEVPRLTPTSTKKAPLHLPVGKTRRPGLVTPMTPRVVTPLPEDDE